MARSKWLLVCCALLSAVEIFAAQCVEPATHVRWMIRRDMPAVLDTDSRSFDSPWSEETFIRALRHRNCIGMVTERNDKVVGFMIYELHKNRLNILNFAVAPEARNTGVGRAMIDKLLSKLSHERRNKIMVEVRETNLDGLKFFAKMGFRAVSVLRKWYEDTLEDGILMVYAYRGDERYLKVGVGEGADRPINVADIERQLSALDREDLGRAAAGVARLEENNARIEQAINAAENGQLSPDLRVKLRNLLTRLSTENNSDAGAPLEAAAQLIRESKVGPDQARAILNAVMSWTAN